MSHVRRRLIRSQRDFHTPDLNIVALSRGSAHIGRVRCLQNVSERVFITSAPPLVRADTARVLFALWFGGLRFRRGSIHCQS